MGWTYNYIAKLNRDLDRDIFLISKNISCGPENPARQQIILVAYVILLTEFHKLQKCSENPNFSPFKLNGPPYNAKIKKTPTQKLFPVIINYLLFLLSNTNPSRFSFVVFVSAVCHVIKSEWINKKNHAHTLYQMQNLPKLLCK